MPKRSADPVLCAALDESVGPVVVVDAERAVLHTSAAAAALLGGPLPTAWLAAGEATTTLTRTGDAGLAHTLHLRAQPLERDGAALGWLVWVSDAAALPDEAPVLFHGMWTRDPAMKRVFHITTRAAARDVTILVRGPTGAGKELLARAVHALSARADGPIRVINCAALPPNLLESELFGHVKGAFTGAVRDNVGIFRTAHRGTLFLDEVAEMPLDLQAKLLRVLETRTIIPVGGTDPIEVDVRIVAATHQSLRAAVEQGRFRADLMYRLRVVPIFLPSLAARRGDVELLAHHFIKDLNQGGGRRITRIAPDALDALNGYAWPGNIRELRNALEYAYVIGDGPVLVEADLPSEVSGLDHAGRAPLIAPPVETSEAQRIQHALERADGNRERAAQSLGMSRVTLWRRMRTYGLLDPDEVKRAEP
ncbi:MAG TPA: sigma 54-interacting transcriptional regulator [Kofleriaceae bacterium]|nr:sigma 54-interacting transcriptional regulator [Kofleriaceae bacterium]